MGSADTSGAALAGQSVSCATDQLEELHLHVCTAHIILLMQIFPGAEPLKQGLQHAHR